MRRHGETPNEWQARAAFMIQRRVATAAKLAEWEFMRMNGVAIPVVELTVSCGCGDRAHPHFHTEIERRPFQYKQPPGRSV